MINHYCTLFDYNYMAFGINLIESLKEHDQSAKLYVVTMDNISYDQLKELDYENVVLISGYHIEKKYSELNTLKIERSKTEYFFTYITRCFRAGDLRSFIWKGFQLAKKPGQ